MKSLFKKHYERNKRNNAAVKHPVSLAESKSNVATVERLHAEEGDTPYDSKNISDKILSQARSLSTLSDSVESQKGESTDIRKQVVDYGSYQQTQPNSATAEHLTVSVDSCSCERSNRGRSLSEGNDARNSSSNVPDNNLSHTGRFGISVEGTDIEKYHSDNILKQDKVHVVESKIFSQVKCENQDHTHLTARKDDIELHRDSASADNIGHQKIQNTAAARGFQMVPKKVRIWDGESKCASFLILNL